MIICLFTWWFLPYDCRDSCDAAALHVVVAVSCAALTDFFGLSILIYFDGNAKHACASTVLFPLPSSSPLTYVCIYIH